MPFDQNQIPEWNAGGVEPPQSKKDNGWGPGEKPPADWFNWFFNRTYNALKTLFTNAQHKEEKGQPNGYAGLDSSGKVPASQLPPAPVTSVNGKTGAVTLTKSDVGLGNVDNVQQIPMSQKGQPGGVAELDASGKVPTSQLPDIEPPVTSVNGKTGAVVLNASDVGAPTVQQHTNLQNQVTAHLADTAAHGIGDKSTLLTTNKNTIVEAINELFTFANDGKTQIANAITAKGVPASPTDTFTSLAAKIGQINTGKKWAMGTASRSASTLPFTVNTDGSTTNLYYITVTGLEFSPKTVLYVRDNNYFPGSVSIEAGWPTHNGYQGVNLTNQQIRLTGNAYISANGFQLPVNDPATTWYWIAFE